MADHKTVQDVTFDLLRTLGLTTIFGNPGSTEETFLQDFPEDFEYVLALQEASALAMADGFAQATGKPALVNLHTAAGTGNAIGSLVAAYRANTPMIVTAGQQTREMSLIDPLITGWVRDGHPETETTRLAIEVAAAATRHTGVPADRVLVVFSSSPAHYAVEGGRVLPAPGEEAAWLAAALE